jgi:hypothetical protein
VHEENPANFPIQRPPTIVSSGNESRAFVLSQYRFPAYTSARLSQLWQQQYVVNDTAMDACRRAEQVRVVRFLVRRNSDGISYQSIPSFLRRYIMSYLETYLYAVSNNGYYDIGTKGYKLWSEDFTKFTNENQRLIRENNS